jgi:serine/threonine protein kinase/Flp pilus assembly protein TadD
MASAVRRRWGRGRDPDAAAVLAKYPQLGRYRSVVVELAYDEYCLRQEAGESLDPADFAERFPSFQRSLCLYIEMHRILERQSESPEARRVVEWPKPGDHFLGFELLAELGRGTFARVYLASEPALGGRLVALKVAPQGGEEAEILGRLHHANIVPVYSVQADRKSGLTAFCMPYLGRATLADVLDRLPTDGRLPLAGQVVADAVREANDDLPWLERPATRRTTERSYVDEIVSLARQMAEALAYAHSRGVYHRDLKPSNVLLGTDGTPLLLDFNLSADERLAAWKVGGTLPYMAPEELCVLLNTGPAWSARHFDPRSDLFSLGVILYELLTGRMPFGPVPWDAPVDAIARQLREAQTRGPQPIRAVQRQVDNRLAALVESCLAFHPEDRPAGAVELASALRKELGPWRRTRRWALWHRGAVATAGTALLALLLGTPAALALRPAYDQRQLQRGSAYLAQGEFRQARDCFSDAVRANPRSAEARFARARAEQELGDYSTAFEDYEAAYSLAPSAELTACKAYCLSRLAQHEQAIAGYQAAMDAGCCSPALLNDLGFCCLQRRRYDEAEVYLRRALEMDEDLYAAHHNLALVFLQRAMLNRSAPLSEDALIHSRRAAELGPANGELYRDVAFVFALAASRDQSLAPQAVEYAKRSVRNGVRPSVFLSSPDFKALRANLVFEKGTARSADVRLARAQLLMDPLSGRDAFP